MTWFSLYAIVAPILLITAFIYYKKKRGMIISIAILCLAYFAYEFYSWMDEPYYGFEYYSITAPNKTSDFSVALESGVIIETITNQPIIYRDYDDKVKMNVYRPLYLKHLNDDFDLIIFTRDENKSLPYGLYTQDDYEFNRKHQSVLIVLEKETGRLIKIRTYDIIGFTLDLNHIISMDQTFAIPVFKPYTNTVQYYFALFINSDDNFTSITEHYLFYTKDSKLEHYAFGNGFYLGVFEDGSINYSRYSYQRQITIRDGKVTELGSSFGGGPLDALDDQLYVKQGYFTVVNRTLYVVKNDLKIYRMNGNESIYIADVIDLSLWQTQIPQ